MSKPRQQHPAIGETMGLDEVAAYLHVGCDTAAALLGDGHIPGARLGRAWVVHTQDLREYLRTRAAREAEARRQAAADREARAQAGAGGAPLAVPAVEQRRRGGRRPAPELPAIDRREQ